MTDLEEPTPRDPGDSGPGTERSDDRVGTQGWVRLGLLLLALVVLTEVAGPWGLVMVLGLVVMIFLHELGHFIMAKRAGMKVTEFFLGFGPRLWSVQKGETEYGIKAIPAGAYVRIIGMHNLEEVAPEDEDRTYREKPFWQRFGVAVAGSTMHFLQALVLIFIILVFTGTPGGTLMPPTSSVAWSVQKVYDSCPAKAAGIHEGDHVVAIDGQKVTSWDDTATVLQDHPNETIHMTVVRDGKLVHTTVRLGSRTVDGKQVGMLGVQVQQKSPPVERVGVLSAIPQTFHDFATVAGASVEGLMRLFTPSHLRSYGRQVANAQRDAQSQSTTPATTTPATTPGTSTPPSTTPATPDSSSSKACAAALAAGTGGSRGSSDTSSLDQQSRLTSIYGIFQLGKGVGQTGGIAALLGIFALINIFIGIFNLLPTLPFDGGHVVIAVYEKFQEWRLHLRTRYLMDVKRLLPLTYGVIMVLGLIFVSSLYLDIVNPISVK